MLGVCFMMNYSSSDEKWVKENGGYEYTPQSMNHLMEVKPFTNALLVLSIEN